MIVCHTPHKRQYDRTQALRVRSHGYQVYRCSTCRWWHVTSMTRAQQKAMLKARQSPGHTA